MSIPVTDLSFASIQTLKDMLAARTISAHELLEHSLKRFAQHDENLGSALEIFDKESVVKASSSTGSLAGIPGILKDNIAQKGRRLTCASKILENYYAVQDATATERLKNEGALLIGRANCDEFAMGSSTETSAYKKTKNPWDFSRVPGGSSGGSIAAVAAGFVPWALGSETGGSVRQPAAFCGVVGLKPTYGLVSRNGLVAYASSLDQIGIATRSVYDSALVLSAIAGQDAKDSSTLPINKQEYARNLDGVLPKGIRIGVVENALHAEGVDTEVVEAIEEAIRALERIGATVKRVALPSLEYSAAAYFILSRAEAASNLARFDGVRYGLRSTDGSTLQDMYANTRHDGFGEEVRRRIMIGNYVLSAGHAGDFYANAQKVQRVIRRDFLENFKEVDCLVMPTHPAPAFTFGAFDRDKLQMDLQDYFTCPINLAGIPALSVPCGMSASRLPIGFQFVGPHLSEELLFKVGHAYQQVTAWHTMHPRTFLLD